jgi:hypothetical protein
VLEDRKPAWPAARRRLRSLLAIALLVLPVSVAACGGDDDNRTQVRPPVPRNVSVVIGQDDVTASPDNLGAGPLTLLVSNQSGASRTLRIDGPQLTRSVGPIQPEDTATVKVTVQPGALELAAADTEGVKPARVTVGPKRPSAQNTLLLP